MPSPPRLLLPPPSSAAATFEVGQSPTIKEAQAIADDIFADFVSEVGADGQRAGPPSLRFASLV